MERYAKLPLDDAPSFILVVILLAIAAYLRLLYVHVLGEHAAMEEVLQDGKPAKFPYDSVDLDFIRKRRDFLHRVQNDVVRATHIVFVGLTLISTRLSLWVLFRTHASEVECLGAILIWLDPFIVLSFALGVVFAWLAHWRRSRTEAAFRGSAFLNRTRANQTLAGS